MAQEPEFKDGMMFLSFDNQKIPEFKQVRGKDWIYWGEDNMYPDYLIDLYHRSSTHNAIITGKVNYILGNGWKAQKKGIKLFEQALIAEYVKKANNEESLDELSEKVNLDFEIFNAFALEVIFSKSGKSFELYHMPFNKLRTNEDETKYWYSKNWEPANQSEEKTGLKEYAPFDFEKRKNGIFVYKIVSPRKGKDPNVYPTPEYIGSTQAIETDVECSNYNLNEIRTGFSAGAIIDFYNGIPDDEKKKQIEALIKKKFTGTDKAGSIILNFAESRDKGSDVKQISGNDLDKRYIELKKDVRQEIFTGHKVTDPSLFGVKAENVVFERAVNSLSQEMFQNSYVNRRQRILEKVFNSFAKLKGVPPYLNIQPLSIVSNDFFTEATIVSLMPPAALRDIIADKLGIDLEKYANKPIVTTTSTNAKMAAQEDFEFSILQKFESIGRPRNEFEIIRTYETFKRKDELKPIDKSILDLLNKDHKMPAEEIAKALKTDVQTIKDEIKSLVDNEYLSPSTEKSGGADIPVYEPSAEAIDIIDNTGAKTIDIEVLYSYELRSNAPKLLPGGESRPFCKKLMDMDKLYTREEIDLLSNEFDTDVWTYKGGWYTNPNTDAPTPQCRHIWKQNIVKRK